MAQLVSAEATIHSLTQEVESLGSSEAMARLRQSYDSALSQAEHRHRDALASLQQETSGLREQVQEKVCLFVCLFSS